MRNRLRAGYPEPVVLTLRDIYECSETHFWDELFFDEAYNRALYRDGLGFSEMDILGDEVEPNGERRRRSAGAGGR